MEEKIMSIKNNHTWDMLDLPKHKVHIPVRWLFKVKLKLDDSIIRHKARLAAKDFMCNTPILGCHRKIKNKCVWQKRIII